MVTRSSTFLTMNLRIVYSDILMNQSTKLRQEFPQFILRNINGTPHWSIEIDIIGNHIKQTKFRNQSFESTHVNRDEIRRHLQFVSTSMAIKKSHYTDTY